MKSEWLLHDDLNTLLQQFPNALYAEPFGQGTIRIPAPELDRMFASLRQHPEFPMEMLTDVTAVDYLESQSALRPNLTGREAAPLSPTRFDVVYHFYSVSKNKRVRIVTSCGGENPAVPSSYPWWRAAHFLEREVWDMFGIQFTNHPNLKRVLLWEGFQGHPLRKDYPTDAEQPIIPLRNPELDHE